jgi:hypothetical protein
VGVGSWTRASWGAAWAAGRRCLGSAAAGRRSLKTEGEDTEVKSEN